MESKKEIKKALEKAKELEAETIPSEEEIIEDYRKDMAKFDKIRKLLEPAWFISGKKPIPKKKSEKKKASKQKIKTPSKKRPVKKKLSKKPIKKKASKSHAR